MGYSLIDEFFNKNWIRATFIMPNGKLDHRTCLYEVNDTFKVKDWKCRYIIDRSCFHYEGKIAYLEYFFDNPNPISYIHAKNIWNGHVITSEVFNIAMESKVIMEMISVGHVENLFLIMLGVAIFLGLANLAISSGVIHFEQAAQVINATINATANMTG